MQSPETIIKLFREKGLRITPQRRFIFELLAEDLSHPTVDDVYRKLKKMMPEVSRSTVYNILHELVEMGELQEVERMSAEGMRYDPEISHHHHLYCQSCHQLIDIMEDLNPIDLPPGKTSGFQIQRAQVTFYGICPECQV